MSSIQSHIRSIPFRSFLSSTQARSHFMPKQWAYDARGVLVRMFTDALMANVGLILGYVFTIFYNAYLRPNEVTSAWICDSLLPGWLVVLPLFTVLCILAFTSTGHYSVGPGARSVLMRHALLPLVALVLVYCLCVTAIYFLTRDWTSTLPRSAAVSAFVFSYSLVAGLRVGKQVFSKRYHVEPRRGCKLPRVKYVLVVGGAGYIGSVLVRKLLEEQYHVRVLDSLMFGDDAISDLYSDPRFELMIGDFRTVEMTVRALRGMDAVIHLGAIVGDPACALDADYTQSVNTQAVRTIQEICRGYGVRRFLFASTCSVYGAQEQLINEHSPLAPVSLYAQSKIDAEQAILGMQNEEFHPTILRLATAFGLSRRMRFDLVVNLLTAQALKTGNITIFNGHQWRPFIHVNDIARAFLCCLEAPLKLVAGQVFNAGDDDANLTLRELGELVKKLVPGTVVTSRDNSLDRRSYRVDFSKIRRRLNFRCSTAIEAGIEEMVRAIQAGTFPEYQHEKYNNAALLKSVGKQLLVEEPQNGNHRRIRVDKRSQELANVNGALTGAQHAEGLGRS
jgi:nucleoside-diphosphate-sugar epimerase